MRSMREGGGDEEGGGGDMGGVMASADSKWRANEI